jgi:predicted  nucleic acid-binding Zn-ribbon protein
MSSTTVQQAHELKSLQTQKDKAKAELEAAKEEQRDSGRRVNDLTDKLRSIEDRIKKLSEKAAENGEVIVSEHAFLRYFERVLGYDLEDIRKKILNPTAEAAIKQFKSGVFPGQGFKLRVRNNKVVTLLTKEEDE